VTSASSLAQRRMPSPFLLGGERGGNSLLPGVDGDRRDGRTRREGVKMAVTEAIEH
jgi:hypothetical protein